MSTVVSLQLEKQPLTLLVGPDAPEVLQTSNFQLPGMMQVSRFDDGFLVRTGQDEFLLQSASPLLSSLPACWVYQRDDHMLALKGEYWQQVLAYVCHMDLSKVETDDWLMMSVAGVNCWALVTDKGLLLGCDPSVGEYLYHTLADTVQRVNEKFIK